MTFVTVVISALCTDSFKAHSQKGIHRCALTLLWLFLWDAREDLRVQLLTTTFAVVVSLWYYTEKKKTSKGDWPQRKYACLSGRIVVVLSQVPSQYYKDAGVALRGT